MARNKKSATTEDREMIKVAEAAQEAAEDALYRFIVGTVATGFGTTARARKKWDSDFWGLVSEVANTAQEVLAANLQPSLRNKMIGAVALGMARAEEAQHHAS